MARKFAATLAKEYELGNEAEDFFNYIIDSLINGQRQQMSDLFNEMRGYDQKTFLVDFLDESIGIHKSVKNLCIGELIR